MHQFSVLLAASLVVSVAFAAGGNTCRQGNIVNPPSNGQPYYWPLSWRENSTVPHLAAGQTCSWTVTIPAKSFAKVSISAKFTDSFSRVQTVDAAGNFVQMTHEKMEPHYFPEAKMTLAIENEASASFAFKIEWGQIPAVDVIAGIGSHPHLINATNAVYHHDFGTGDGDHISLLTFPADKKKLHHLESVLVYDGSNHGLAGTFINNLGAIYKASRQQFVSPGPGLQLVNLEPSGVLDQVLVQDYQYTQDIAEYTELYCDGNTTCTATVNGGKHKSALISVDYDHQTLIDIQMDAKANLTVYYGSPTNFGFYKSYSGADINSQLPLVFLGSPTQYVISSGKAAFTFTITP